MLTVKLRLKRIPPVWAYGCDFNFPTEASKVTRYTKLIYSLRASQRRAVRRKMGFSG